MMNIHFSRLAQIKVAEHSICSLLSHIFYQNFQSLEYLYNASQYVLLLLLLLLLLLFFEFQILFAMFVAYQKHMRF